MSIPNHETRDLAKVLLSIERAVALNEEDPTEGDPAALARTVSDWLADHCDGDEGLSLSAHIGAVWGVRV